MLFPPATGRYNRTALLAPSTHSAAGKAVETRDTRRQANLGTHFESEIVTDCCDEGTISARTGLDKRFGDLSSTENRS